MFMTHRAWRHAYATAYVQQACGRRRESQPRQLDSMFTWATGPMFGVRRPLRHLVWKLHLDETQTRSLVEVLDRLKTAYGQAKLDRDRSTSELATLMSGDAFDSDRASGALQHRVDATQALNQELLAATKAIFAMLDAEQRREFAYLLRSGTFVL